MQNATCEVHLDPNPKFHHQPLSARHQEPGDARAMGSPETRLTYLDGRAPMFDTVPKERPSPVLPAKNLSPALTASIEPLTAEIGGSLFPCEEGRAGAPHLPVTLYHAWTALRELSLCVRPACV